MHSYLMICVRQVDTFPTNHFLHNQHHCASTPLSGCLPSLKTATRSAIWVLLPVLECIMVFLRAYPYSMVSQIILGLTHMLHTCASFVAILSNCENSHSSSSDSHPIASDLLASSIDAFLKSSQLLETSVFAQVS